jgi:hypothetical protein
MSKILDKLASPNFWVAIGSLFGVAGIGLMLGGFFAGNEDLTRLGMWLLTPLLLGGIALVSVVIPILIRANRKHKRD